MNNYRFTADTHFNHSNIIKYSNRPFKDAKEMDKELIKRWNEKCNNQSLVYHLGDVFFSNDIRYFDDIISQLNFERLVVIRGNHDRCFDDWMKSRRPKNIHFYGSHYETKVNAHDFTLNHYAMRVWNKSHHGAYHLYGHSHGTLPDLPESRSFDVGVDCHNYYPLTFEEVMEIMAKKTWKSPY